MLRACLARLLADEDGAVTVDWVALTGALVGLGVLVILDVSQGATDAASAVGAELNHASIINITFLATPPNGASAAGPSSSGLVAP